MKHNGIEVDIASYVVWLQRRNRDYKNTRDVPVTAIITTHPQDEGLPTRPNKFFFIFVDSDIVPDTYVENREVFAFVSARFYMHYIDLVRTEKPIKVIWERDIGSCMLATGRREPVGEGPGERPRV